MVRIPTHRQPTHPGEMLLEEFLILQRKVASEKLKLSQLFLAV
jgi:plasmid maintenance system antidote protein VapI